MLEQLASTVGLPGLVLALGVLIFEKVRRLEARVDAMELFAVRIVRLEAFHEVERL